MAGRQLFPATGGLNRDLIPVLRDDLRTVKPLVLIKGV
jgi:hypothetical protein